MPALIISSITSRIFNNFLLDFLTPTVYISQFSKFKAAANASIDLDSNTTNTNLKERSIMPNAETTMYGDREEQGSVTRATETKSRRGLGFRRFYTEPGVHPFDMIE